MAKAIVSHRPKPASNPATPSAKILAGALQTKLDAAHLAIERLDSVISVVVTALYNQDTDLDSSLAICLENGAEAELNPARERIEEALKLLAEVANG